MTLAKYIVKFDNIIIIKIEDIAKLNSWSEKLTWAVIVFIIIL